MTALTESPRADEPRPDTPARPDRRYAVALTALLLGTGALYLWDLAASGWANSFYAAAAQAGSQSWTAFLFGSSDAANAITVDKPPASLWVMSLSIRAFGLSSWSLLLPQALMGVASVALLVAAVRRWAGPVAGLLAGLVLALTPVAVLMFRFDNPDALLVLLMTAAAYAVVRATDTDRGRAVTGWLVLGGVLLGLGFLTKMLQVGLVVPGLAAAYLLAGSGTLRGRFGRLALAGVAFVVSAGWWVLLVELVPSGSRPYVGGSQTDSVWELVWGYNGLGRLTGDEVGSVGGGGGDGSGDGSRGGPGGGFGGEAGIGRLFSASFAGQASWLLPTALQLLVTLVGLTWRRPRTDRLRAAAVLWGGWLLVTAAVFSAMSGIIHEYYIVALAPAVAAMVGVGAVALWDRRDRLVARLLAAATVLVTATWSWELLGRSADFLPWLRWVVLAVGVLATAGLVLTVMVRHRVFLAAVVAGTVLTGLAGPSAYAAQTVVTPHSGSIVTAGPQVDDGERGGPGGGPGGDGAPPTGAPPTGMQGAPQGLPQGAPPGGGGGAPGGGAGGPGGLLDAAEPDADVLATLMEERGRTWLAATIGSQSAAGYQLATEEPVMAVGGFNGSDPAPTLEEFQDLVADGRIGWFVTSGVSGRSDGGSEAASEIAAWVEATFSPVELGSTTLYRLAAG